ncbi:TlpA family protein disulfide reductase [Aestuariibaculum suncheonense]|uniref:Thioredoxin domain-containing protein n=1 Tax=Aestuariibaculum suncheonense TaxID=1028745 RepID=A0A8J6QDA8_9FLAO|nr:hypothetical protein [Aestuariibaculum suncheonense]MBD0835025.1 hypothetical protein [Aestuariibaculum suncheonense]
MRLHYICILLGLSVFNCVEDKKAENENYAYFGGEIINPGNDFVVLSKANKIIDTVKLDNRNRFLYKFENVDNGGLYTFHHGGEIQIVFLEPKDSLLFRLNTLDFDESLVYTGIGDKKNNYLVNEFLVNELQEKIIFQFCQLSPELFTKRIDSLKFIKLKNLKLFKDRYETSDLFDKIALADINFNYYLSKEVYPFVHYGRDKNAILESLPENFYDYRKDIDYNDAFFKDNHYYDKFLKHNFNNMALKEHYHHNEKQYFNRSSLCYTLDKLELIDSLVSNQVIKDGLLYDYTINYLAKSTDSENNNKLLKSFLNKSTDEKNNEELKRFVSMLDLTKIGATFPSVKVVDFKNNELDLKESIDKPTVITFWSHIYYDHFKKSHIKLKELRTKYPEVNFVSINIDNYDSNTIRKSLVDKRFPLQYEYVLKNPKISKEFLAIQPMTKTYLVDKHQTIVNSNANIFASNFEEEVLGMINR